jgi:hypothetical protein
MSAGAPALSNISNAEPMNERALKRFSSLDVEAAFRGTILS